MSTTRVLCALLTALAVTIFFPGSASASTIAAEYCVEVAPGTIAGVIAYPGGKYCVPGP